LGPLFKILGSSDGYIWRLSLSLGSMKNDLNNKTVFHQIVAPETDEDRLES